MLRGLALVNMYADDLDAAKRWYAELLGIDAYFDRPGYTEFRVGDYQHELGSSTVGAHPPVTPTGRAVRGSSRAST